MNTMFDLLIAILIAPFVIAYVACAAIFNVTWDVGEYGYRLFWGSKKLNTHGDADWAKDKELKKAGNFEAGGFLLCHTESGKPIYAKRNRGAIVLAAPDQGKSVNIVANFRSKQFLHFSQRQHLLVHDPAGELHAKGKAILEAHGYLVCKIDLINPASGIVYDLQSFLDPKRVSFGNDLRSMCEGVIAEEPNSRQPHFVEYARKMLQDAIARNMLFKEGRQSFPEVVAELLNEKKRTAMIKDMESLPYDFNALDVFNKMSGPEGVSMLSTSLRKLDPWTLENIALVSKTEAIEGNPRGWSFEHMFNSVKPCALFVRTGLSPGGGDFARAVFSNAVNTIRRDWDAIGMANPRGLQVFIDEAAKLGKCTALLEGHNELRKANYSQFLSYVSFTAMKDAFGPDAETLFNGCDHIIFPGNQDMDTNERYSKIIGEMTIESGSRSENSYGESKGKNEQARRLVKADEIRRSEFTRCYAIAGNLAIKGRKAPPEA